MCWCLRVYWTVLQNLFVRFINNVGNAYYSGCCCSKKKKNYSEEEGTLNNLTEQPHVNDVDLSKANCSMVVSKYRVLVHYIYVYV